MENVNYLEKVKKAFPNAIWKKPGPGARFYFYNEVPDIMKKIHIEKIVKITA